MALRIKENVDLKELEKFGFKYIKNNHYRKDINYYYVYFDDIKTISIGISSTREIVKLVSYSYHHITYFAKRKHLWKKDIKDLIEAGLVEKV